VCGGARTFCDACPARQEFGTWLAWRMPSGPSGSGAEGPLELNYLGGSRFEGWVGSRVENRCAARLGPAGGGCGQVETGEGRRRGRQSRDKVGNDSRKSSEGEGVHDDFRLVTVEHEVSGCTHPAIFVEAGAEVKLDASIYEGQDLATKCTVGPHLLSIKELMFTDVRAPASKYLTDSGVWAKDDGEDDGERTHELPKLVFILGYAEYDLRAAGNIGVRQSLAF
jgi:hypothetical protein